MEINTLSCEFFEQNGGSFEPFVDGISLAEHVNYEDSLIPYWIIDKGIPTIPPYETPERISERIVAVCGCGEYGCDCITCKVEIRDDSVTFSEFKRPGYSRTIDKRFVFAKESFEKVEHHLTVEAEKIKKSFEKKS